MLGVVRIYSRKVNYLFQDCSEAIVKIKQVFRPGTVDLPADATTAPGATITLPSNFDDLEFFFDPGHAAGSHGRASVSKENITLGDPDLDDFDAQFEYNERLPVDDERLEDDVEVEVFRSAVVEAGVQLEDYDYAHDTFDAPNGDDFNGGVDDSGDEFGAGNDDVMPLALDPDLMDDEDEFAARKSIGGESLFGGTLPLPSIPGSSVMGDRPDDDRVPGPASKRRKVERVMVSDRAVTLSNDHIRAQLRDTRDIVNRKGSVFDDDAVLADPETLEASLRGRLMACDVGSKLNDAYRKASAVCWSRPESVERRGQHAEDAAEDAAPFTMNFDYADNDDGFGGDAGFVEADDINVEMNVEEAGAEEEEGDMDWNVNSKIMLEHLTSAFSSSGDRPLSLNNLTHGKKRGEAARMFYQVLVLNAHEYLKVDQMTAFGDVAISKGAAFAST